MKGLHIDAERRLAWAQPGLTAGEYTAAAGAHGLATPFGDTGSVGLAGLTLGGGIGWLVRKYGLAIDALVSVEIVTADGRLIIASETEHPDLFWAVRGGGGNFGVVTRFQFKLYPGRQIYGGALFMPPTRDVLRALEPIAAQRPRGPLDHLVHHGAPRPRRSSRPRSSASRRWPIMFVYDGDPEAGGQAIAPFRQVATPMAELVDADALRRDLPDARRPPSSALRPAIARVFLDALDDDVVDTILDFTMRRRARRWR